MRKVGESIIIIKKVKKVKSKRKKKLQENQKEKGY